MRLLDAGRNGGVKSEHICLPGVHDVDTCNASLQFERNPVRVNIKRKVDWAILTAAFITASVMGMGILAGAATEEIPAANDTSRLVSVQALPENFFACSWDDPTGETADVAAPEEETLFSALHEDPSPSVLMRGAV